MENLPACLDLCSIIPNLKRSYKEFVASGNPSGRVVCPGGKKGGGGAKTPVWKKIIDDNQLNEYLRKDFDNLYFFEFLEQLSFLRRNAYEWISDMQEWKFSS